MLHIIKRYDAEIVVALTMAVLAGAAAVAMIDSVYAPSGRRWVPAVGDELTLQNGVMNSKLEPNYPIDYAKCMVTENTAEAGVTTLSCQIYAPEDYKEQ